MRFRFTALVPILAGLASGQQPSPPPPAVELPQVRTAVTVFGNIEADTPASVTALGPDEIRQQPGVNTDDRLRSIPGFSLFRRSSSLVANPTTQGVSLRGLGSSGASRTLVLLDSIPINDPFGGWVYWTRVDPNELSRIEVSRGASTSLFGDRAMSGVLTMWSRPAEKLRLTASYEGGNADTQAASAGMSHVWERFATSGHLRGFKTDGYFIVPDDRRGSVDTRAGVDFLAGDARVDFLGSSQNLFLKIDLLAEQRANGTRLTENSTGLGTVSAHYTLNRSAGVFSALGYHSRGVYRASFSSVSANRNTENITFLQRVPSEAVGGAALWKHNGSAWNFIAGTDFQHVEGTSTDRLASGGNRIGGGDQTQQGTFVQASAGTGLWRLHGGARQQFTSGGSKFFSPSGGFQLGRRGLRFRGTVYRAFRAPTLNELFRDFRAGNAETRSNPDLRPETMFGAETGVDIVARPHGRFSLTAFRHELNALITNVTVSVTPQLISRQRRNAGAALARGIEAQWTKSLFEHFRADASYLFADSRFSTGERIPQVPRHSGTTQLSFVRDGSLISVGVRAFSFQFEDDRNQFVLPGFAAVQLAGRQRLKGGLSATAEIDNVLDREYAVGVTAPAAAGLSPLVAIGSPRLWRIGLRWDGPFR